MKKNIIICVLVVLVIVLGYFVWKESKRSTVVIQAGVSANTVATSSASAAQNLPTDSDSDLYFNVPEFGIRFRKVEGLDLSYTIKNNNIIFSSNEIKTASLKDPNISDCITNAFAMVSVSSVPKSQTEYQGYHQINLGNGKYLNIEGQQAMCSNPGATQSDLELITEQTVFFSEFLYSVQAY